MEATMSNEEDKKLADLLYSEGMKYNWRGDESLANETLSRAAFERSAKLGHTKALRELSEMMFLGSGGTKDPEQALLLKWRAFQNNDEEALDELVALLESYSELNVDTENQQRAKRAAKMGEVVGEHLRYIDSFLRELSDEKLRPTSN
jgi:hypothetical protein